MTDIEQRPTAASALAAIVDPLHARIAELEGALERIEQSATITTGSCGVMGGHWAECGYCGAVSKAARTEPIPHEENCPVRIAREALGR